MSPSPRPAPKVEELIDRLARLAQGATIDEFALQRVDREAQALIGADAAGAHTILGAVAALRGDADEAVRRHEIALKLQNDLDVRFNYSVSMTLLERTAAAFEIASETLSLFPDVPELLDHAVRVALDSGHFEAAEKLCDRWGRVCPDRECALGDTARRLAGAVEAGVLDEPAVRELLEIANAIQRDAQVRSSMSRFGTGVPPFLQLRHVFATPARAAELNEALADAVAGRDDLVESPGTTFVVAFAGGESPAGDGPLPTYIRPSLVSADVSDP